MNFNHYTRSFSWALLVATSLMIGWEMYCRSAGFVATLDDDKYLWAEKRHMVRDLDPSQMLIVGASRAHFDFQLDEWEKATGIRPIQLAMNGKSAGPVLFDIVHNTQFNGLIIMNITENLFFIHQHDSIGGYRRAKEWVDFYHDRTWAQRFNHQLSYALQTWLAFLTNGEEGDPDLKSLINAVPLRGRLDEPFVPFPRFAYVDADRNTTMLPKMETDTAFQWTIRRVWMNPRKTQKRDDKVIASCFPFYLNLIRTFKARGGRIILTRNPSHGDYRELEENVYPRKVYWEAFIAKADCPAYHFEDYTSLSQFTTPEWSHLSTPDARIYTRELTGILKTDGHL